MLGKKKQPPIRTLVGEGTMITGMLRFTDGLRIDGEVVGDVVAEGDAPSILVISERARVTGKICAAHVIINGCVNGPIVSGVLLELQPKARIVGDVRYAVLEMHPGASVHGQLLPAGAVERPGLKLAASNPG
jgi:cytoskeletal protein CcmA (bactofilin family)